MAESLSMNKENSLKVIEHDSSLASLKQEQGALEIQQQVEHIRGLSKADTIKLSRRVLFSWLRIYVREKNNRRVNIRIPIPLPLVGLLLPQQMSNNQALALRNQMIRGDDPGQLLEDAMNSSMALELIRVDEEDELVVIGFD